MCYDQEAVPISPLAACIPAAPRSRASRWHQVPPGAGLPFANPMRHLHHGSGLCPICLVLWRCTVIPGCVCVPRRVHGSSYQHSCPREDALWGHPEMGTFGCDMTSPLLRNEAVQVAVAYYGLAGPLQTRLAVGLPSALVLRASLLAATGGAMTSSYAVCSAPAAAAVLCGDPQPLRGPRVLPCWVSAQRPSPPSFAQSQRNKRGMEPQEVCEPQICHEWCTYCRARQKAKQMHSTR